MLWGYANGWWPEFLSRDKDPLYAKLKFLLAYGLKETGVPIEDVIAMSDADRARLGRFLADNDLHLTPYVGYDYVNAPPEEAARASAELIAALREFVPLLRAWSVFTRAGCTHRFDHAMPVEEKIERLCAALVPIASACHALGTPLAINNQGEFYISDFVEMCERTPHLFIHLDTANIFWAGERIHPAFETCAPYVVGTHWRDELISIGVRDPRGVLLHNCVTGEGDVGLRECYDQLVRLAPNPKRLVMEIEMFPQSGISKTEALERSLAFVRSLAIERSLAFERRLPEAD